MKLYESTYYQIEMHDEYLRIQWLESTAQMSFQDFKDALTNLAGYNIEYKATRTLVDTINFKFQLPPENIEWRDKEYHPRVVKAGTDSKIALILPQEYMQYVKDELDILVPTRYFSDESEAVAWLVQS
jgi:hypothetical protein